MAGPTKQQIEEYIKNNNLNVDVDESYPRSDWWKFRDERDAYKKQRDELVKDIEKMKKKAEAFDEILDINVDKDEFLSEEYIEKIEDVIQKWIFS